jgi:RHH-type rel operon transcriptional repressor/antitoxin RelB
MRFAFPIGPEGEQESCSGRSYEEGRIPFDGDVNCDERIDPLAWPGFDTYDANMITLCTGGFLMPTTTLTVRVDPDVAKRLEKLARATKRSRCYLAAEAIEEYLVVQEWQVEAILAGIDEADRGEGVDFEQVKASWESKLEDPSD